MTKLTGIIMSENKLTGSLGVRNEINVDIIGTGARGKEGKSAYEIWLDLGNEGTEQEYLASLKGQDGHTPVKGVDYFDGEKGIQGVPGLNGKSLEFLWSDTQLGIRIEGESTYQYVNLEGEKGEKGAPGTNGKDGADGATGKDGVDGYTPVKGKDYFTETDKAEIVSSVIAALPVYDGSVAEV